MDLPKATDRRKADAAETVGTSCIMVDDDDDDVDVLSAMVTTTPMTMRWDATAAAVTLAVRLR